MIFIVIPATSECLITVIGLSVFRLRIDKCQSASTIRTIKQSWQSMRRLFTVSPWRSPFSHFLCLIISFLIYDSFMGIIENKQLVLIHNSFSFRLKTVLCCLAKNGMSQILTSAQNIADCCCIPCIRIMVTRTLAILRVVLSRISWRNNPVRKACPSHPQWTVLWNLHNSFVIVLSFCCLPRIPVSGLVLGIRKAPYPWLHLQSRADAPHPGYYSFAKENGLAVPDSFLFSSSLCPL